MRKNIIDVSVSLLIILYVLYFSVLNFLKFNSFGYHDYDLATNAYSIWGISQGIFYNSIFGGHFLGNHAHFIFFPLAAIHLFLPHPLTLLFLQTIFLGLGALPVYLLAKQEIGKQLGLLTVLMYLLYPALGYTNLFEFHPTAFSTTFLMFMFYYFKKERLLLSLIFAILALLCQENIALVIMMFGLYCLFKRPHLKWGIAVFLLGLSWFYACVFIIIPHFNQGTFQLFKFYSHFGPNLIAAIKNILLHPAYAFKFILGNFINLKYLLSLFTPLAFISLLGWQELLIALPLFAQHLLSNRLTEHTIYYHYTAEMIPFIFIATVFGLKRIKSSTGFNKLKIIFVSTVISVAIIANISLGPQLRILANLKSFYRGQRDLVKERFVKMIPQEAAVVATFEFLPHLLYRKEIYSFHNIVTGQIPYSDRKFILPKSVEYALIDFADPLTFKWFYREGTGDTNLKNFFSDKWDNLEYQENIVLLKREFLK